MTCSFIYYTVNTRRACFYYKMQLVARVSSTIRNVNKTRRAPAAAADALMRSLSPTEWRSFEEREDAKLGRGGGGRKINANKWYTKGS